MGNNLLRMWCCLADDDGKRSPKHISLQHREVRTSIDISSKLYNMHSIERPTENGRMDGSPRFPRLNQLLASPRKFDANADRDTPSQFSKPLVSVYPEPQCVFPGLDDAGCNFHNGTRYFAKGGARPSTEIYFLPGTTEVRPFTSPEQLTFQECASDNKPNKKDSNDSSDSFPVMCEEQSDTQLRKAVDSDDKKYDIDDIKDTINADHEENDSDGKHSIKNTCSDAGNVISDVIRPFLSPDRFVSYSPK